MRLATGEAAFQLQVEHLAHLYGWRTFHAPDNRPRRTRTGRVAKQRVTPGWPDLVLCRPPELIIAELKGPTTRVTDAQREWLAALAECGIEVYLWRPVDMDAIHARLARRRGTSQDPTEEAA